MTTNELSLEELLAQHEALSKQIAEIKSTKKAEIIASIKAQIAAYDLTVTDLFEAPEASKKTRAPRGTATPKTKAPPKYRNPDNPTETYGGKGPAPEWYTTYKKTTRAT